MLILDTREAKLIELIKSASASASTLKIPFNIPYRVENLLDIKLEKMILARHIILS